MNRALSAATHTASRHLPLRRGGILLLYRNPLLSATHPVLGSVKAFTISFSAAGLIKVLASVKRTTGLFTKVIPRLIAAVFPSSPAGNEPPLRDMPLVSRWSGPWIRRSPEYPESLGRIIERQAVCHLLLHHLLLVVGGNRGSLQATHRALLTGASDGTAPVSGPATRGECHNRYGVENQQKRE